MARKDNGNPFAKAASKRQAEQDALKQGLAQDAAAGAAQEDGGADEARVKLTLALSAGDKFRLKTAAARRGVTVAKLVHEWIEMLD